MVVENTPIYVNNVLIENVEGSTHYSLTGKNQDKEIQRRIMADWASYAKHRDILKSNIAICVKRQVCNSCVLPAMTYCAETWRLTKQAPNKLAAVQSKIERSVRNIIIIIMAEMPSHTRIEMPTSGSGNGQSYRYNQQCETTVHMFKNKIDKYLVKAGYTYYKGSVHLELLYE